MGDIGLLGLRVEHAESDMSAQVLEVALNQTSLSHPPSVMLWGLWHKLRAEFGAESHGGCAWLVCEKMKLKECLMILFLLRSS